MAFYSQAQSLSSADIVALCKRQVQTNQEREWGWAEDGAFKPLSVWATLGHDPKIIEEKARPQDKRVHPDYGWDEYRVGELKAQQSDKVKVSDSLQI